MGVKKLGTPKSLMGAIEQGACVTPAGQGLETIRHFVRYFLHGGHVNKRKQKTKCSCGIEYKGIPAAATYFSGGCFSGHYFNCKCKSTLFWPDAKRTQEKRSA